MSPRLLLAAVAAVAAPPVGQLAGSTLAAFSATTATPGTCGQGGLPGDALVVGVGPAGHLERRRDGRLGRRGVRGTTTRHVELAAGWSTARYMTFDMNDPLPAGVAATGVAFGFDFADNANGAGHACASTSRSSGAPRARSSAPTAAGQPDRVPGDDHGHHGLDPAA